MGYLFPAKAIELYFISNLHETVATNTDQEDDTNLYILQQILLLVLQANADFQNLHVMFMFTNKLGKLRHYIRIVTDMKLN